MSSIYDGDLQELFPEDLTVPVIERRALREELAAETILPESNAPDHAELSQLHERKVVPQT